MNWIDARAQYSDVNGTWNVFSTSFVIELYGEGKKLAVFGKPILDVFMKELPEGRSLYQLGGNSREYKQINNTSLRRIKKTLSELEQRGRFYMIKDAPDFDAGSYSVELHLGSEHVTTNDSVHIALPLKILDNDLEHAVELVRIFVKDFPFWGVAAGYGFNLVWARECEMVGMPVMIKTALRFHGLLVRDRLEESYAVKKLKSAGWLTYLDAELLEAIGGESAVDKAAKNLGDSVGVSEIRGGVFLRAGERPLAGDVNRQDKDIKAMAVINRLITNVRVEKWLDPSLFGVPPESANGWLSRFD